MADPGADQPAALEPESVDDRVAAAIKAVRQAVAAGAYQQELAARRQMAGALRAHGGLGRSADGQSRQADILAGHIRAYKLRGERGPKPAIVYRSLSELHTELDDLVDQAKGTIAPTDVDAAVAASLEAMNAATKRLASRDTPELADVTTALGIAMASETALRLAQLPKSAAQELAWARPLAERLAVIEEPSGQREQELSLPDIRTSGLSARHLQYLQLYMAGETYESIAKQLGVKPETVQQTLSRIRRLFPGSLPVRVERRTPSERRTPRLTDRQKRYIQLYKNGGTDESIAKELGVKPETVQPTLSRIRRLFPGSLPVRVERRTPSEAGTSGLTARDHRYLQLYMAGETYESIAKQLGVKPETVQQTLSRISRRLPPGTLPPRGRRRTPSEA